MDTQKLTEKQILLPEYQKINQNKAFLHILFEKRSDDHVNMKAAAQRNNIEAVLCPKASRASCINHVTAKVSVTQAQKKSFGAVNRLSLHFRSHKSNANNVKDTFQDRPECNNTIVGPKLPDNFRCLHLLRRLLRLPASTGWLRLLSPRFADWHLSWCIQTPVSNTDRQVNVPDLRQHPGVPWPPRVGGWK